MQNFKVLVGGMNPLALWEHSHLASSHSVSKSGFKLPACGEPQWFRPIGVLSASPLLNIFFPRWLTITNHLAHQVRNLLHPPWSTMQKDRSQQTKLTFYTVRKWLSQPSFHLQKPCVLSSLGRKNQTILYPPSWTPRKETEFVKQNDGCSGLMHHWQPLAFSSWIFVYLDRESLGRTTFSWCCNGPQCCFVRIFCIVAVNLFFSSLTSPKFLNLWPWKFWKPTWIDMGHWECLFCARQQ